MVWTRLRACYGFDMRVYIGGVETIYPARWFFCDPSARVFPNPHGAEASPFLKDHEVNLEWGEVKGRKTLDRGINPGYPGQCFVGDPQWFIDGQLPAELAIYKPPVLTPCCGYLPPPNPDPRCPVDPLVDCGQCPSGKAFRRYKVTYTGGTGVFANANGQFPIYSYPNCYWNSVDPLRPPLPPSYPGFEMTILADGSGGLPVGHCNATSATLAQGQYLTKQPWDCLVSPNEMILIGYYNFIDSGVPGQIVLTSLED